MRISEISDDLHASYTDKDGYTVHVYARQPGEILGNDGHDDKRAGRIEIEDPSGVRVKGGYWMDYPEHHWPEWTDWEKHWEAGTESEADWYKLPIKVRLAREAEQQATAYKPLKQQWLELSSRR